MTRRALLKRALTVFAAPASLTMGACLKAPLGVPRERVELPKVAMTKNRVSLAQWSLHRKIRDGQLDPMDFPAFARATFSLAGVEYVSLFYRQMPADGSWARELRRRADDAGVTSVLIMVDDEGEIGDPDSSARERTVEAHRRWLDAAAVLGCHSIRVNALSVGSPEVQCDLCADGIARLCEYAAPSGMAVIVENHGGMSCLGEWVAAVVKKVNLPNCGTLPDFGNFQCADGTMNDRYDGVRAMMPFARGVSAKSYDFDAGGEETSTDFARMLAIVRDGGYQGWIGVEYEGTVLGEIEGTLATRDLLLRNGCVA